ncbi:DUF362 domain-containing protein [Thermospira aquatica]|uniref:DUF362 domain-containing protein n=1 Tax=Thermospira aquatica TaxID=2828656 RepID=A0AAX3BBX3_9SPIR|nr:DUF362 domain-containing protein [Thermospira aquatica]URA09787.1 DUF362 domain-containing protein [Thermospira aquatica]
MASPVYFTDFRSKGKSILEKLEKLVLKAGLETINFEKKFVAIKVHFGEPGNVAYIRPNYTRRIVEIIKRLGGLPFLTDCNTLYKGRRSNAIDHLQAAHENGFTPETVGCDLIIADGLKGSDYREIEINLTHIKKAKIGTAIADADIFISINHFKGHEMTGFGGALKNIGMGCGAVPGKLEMHSNSKPKVVTEKCVGCKMCELNCNHNAIKVNEHHKAWINYDLCVGCGQCVAVCRYDAAQVVWNEGGNTAWKKIDEYAFAVVKGKPHFHINFLMDISPDCDCWSSHDAPIVPDIGILASFDPVALDQASVDLVNQAPVLAPSKISDHHPHYDPSSDRFQLIHPHSNWQEGLAYAESIGLGSRTYQLLRVE